MKEDICQCKLLYKGICQGNCQKFPNLLAASISMHTLVACVAGVQRVGRGEVECECEARSLGARKEHLP